MLHDAMVKEKPMTISTMPPKPVTVGGIHKFLFWCQTALPAVYGDELSYLEVLCKVKNVLNEVIEELNVHGEDINVLIELYQQILDMLDYSRKHGYLIKSTTATAINAELAQHASEKPIMFYPLPYSLDAPIIVPCGAYIDFNGATLNRIGGAHDVVVLESCLEKTVLMNAVIDGRMKEDGFDPELPVNRFSGIALRKCSGVHLENMSVTNTCNGEIQPEGANGGLLIDTCDGIRVTGGDFSENDRSGIVAVDSSNVTVERATGSGNGGSFFTSARCSNLKVDGCKAVGNGYTGISLNGTNLHANNCVSNGNKYSGFTFGHEDANPGKLSLCTSCSASGNTLDGVTLSSATASIIGCTFEGNVRNNLYIYTPPSIADQGYLMANGCKFANGALRIMVNASIVSCSMENAQIVAQASTNPPYIVFDNCLMSDFQPPAVSVQGGRVVLDKCHAWAPRAQTPAFSTAVKGCAIKTDGCVIEGIPTVFTGQGQWAVEAAGGASVGETGISIMQGSNGCAFMYVSPNVTLPYTLADAFMAQGTFEFSGEWGNLTIAGTNVTGTVTKSAVITYPLSNKRWADGIYAG